MLTSVQITPEFAVSRALTSADFAEAAARGFKSILNVRPDGESANQLSSAEARIAADAAGLSYAHVPVQKHDLFSNEAVTEAQRTLAHMSGPILAYCASGQRAAILWAASNARTEPVASVLAALKAADFNLDFLRDDLDA